MYAKCGGDELWKVRVGRIKMPRSSGLTFPHILDVEVLALMYGCIDDFTEEEPPLMMIFGMGMSISFTTVLGDFSLFLLFFSRSFFGIWVYLLGG